jgi:hypothetical protein
MPFHRHLVPVWGFVLLALAWSVVSLASRQSALRPLAGALAFVALAFAGWRSAEGSLTLGNPFPARAFEEEPYGVRLVAVGHALAELHVPLTIVSNMVGELPYAAGPQVYVRDVLGLTDAHNAHYGREWVATYGRTDVSYTFGAPFDLLYTNTARDLMNLELQDPPSRRTRHTYDLHTPPGWLDSRFFVVSRDHSPAQAALARFGGELVPLDSAVVAIIRERELSARGWELRGLSDSVGATAARR